MRCLVVEDHPLTRDGTMAALRNIDPTVEVLEAESRAEALQRLCETPPVDLVLLDLDLSDSKGIETLATVKTWCDSNGVDARVVVLSGRCEPDLVREVIANFGTGFIVKAAPKVIFQNAITLTLAGGVFIPDVILQQWTKDGNIHPAVGQVSTPTRPLTQREKEVAALVVHGFSYKRIAKELERLDGKEISVNTVRAHVGNIAWKLGVTENAKAGVMAEIARRGLIFPKTR